MGRMSRDRLLAVSGIAPWPRRGGFSLRAARLLELLAGDWAITLVSGSQIDPDEMPLGSAPHQVIMAPVDSRWTSVPSRRQDYGALAAALGRAIESCRPRVALVFNGTEFLAMREGFPPTVADRVDCGALERFRYLRHGRFTRRPKAVAEMLREGWYERRFVRTLDATIVAGDDDRQALEAIAGAGRVHVVPNGVDLPNGPAFDQEATAPTIAFTGTLSYYANVDAVVYFARRVWPIVRRQVPDARLLIAGRTPTRRVKALARPGEIEVRADVEEMDSVLAEAWIAVAPMRCGTGVKNKVLEAWAAARPVVMTPLATNGLSAIPDPGATVTRRPADFARAVTTLLGNPERRRQLGRTARERVRTHHSWSTSAEAVSEILETVSNRILRT
jgi:glycosyltransferase involved in cell wall biosynthesis